MGSQGGETDFVKVYAVQARHGTGALTMLDDALLQ